jgi:CheY-like chemotaxis protein
MTESVLVIDNDASMVELLSYVFQQEGLTVHRALDGAEGVMLAAAYKPDVIVCDLLMGRLDGFQVLQAIRANPELSHTTVIVVSAKCYKPDIARAKALGADAFLVKPFDRHDLLAAMNRARDSRAA